MFFYALNLDLALDAPPYEDSTSWSNLKNHQEWSKKMI